MHTYRFRFFFGLSILTLFVLFFWLKGPSLSKVLSHYDKSSGKVEISFVALSHKVQVEKIGDKVFNLGLSDILNYYGQKDSLKQLYTKIWLDNFHFSFDTVTDLTVAHWMENASMFDYSENIKSVYALDDGNEIPIIISESKTPHVVFKLENDERLFGYMLARERGSYFEAPLNGKIILEDLVPGSDVDVYFEYYVNEYDSLFRLPSLNYPYRVYKKNEMVLEDPAIHEMKKIEAKIVNGEVLIETNNDMIVWYKKGFFLTGTSILGFFILLSGVNYLNSAKQIGQMKLNLDFDGEKIVIDDQSIIPLEHLTVLIYYKEGNEKIYGACFKNSDTQGITFVSYRHYNLKAVYQLLQDNLEEHKLIKKQFSSIYEGSGFFTFEFADGNAEKYIM